MMGGAAPAAASIAVIPARGGSVRIPRKNVRPFAGEPLIAWPIRTALASGRFASVLVPTDDPVIAEVARAYGAETPFVRPAELADGHTGTRAVLRHAATWWSAHRCPLERVACIYATASFLLPEDVHAAFDRLEGDPGAAYAFTVAPYAHPIERALYVDAGGRVQRASEEAAPARTQDLAPAYYDAGQLYLWRSALLLGGGPDRLPAAAIVLPRVRAIDIDTPDDWELAEAVFTAMRARGTGGVRT
jgi:pseudaminic acid cytidylyltransferase